MLVADNIRYENGVKICEKIMPDGTKSSRYIASWVPAGGLMKPQYSMDPIGITIHNTGDLEGVHEDSEQYVRATYNEQMAGAIVHYYVDDVSAWQLLREDESGWHASDGNGNGNRRTIAIECIMNGSGSQEDLKARDNAARLIAAIMKRHGWDITNLYTHNHWMNLPDKIVYGVRKNCPYYLLPKYDEFKVLVQKYLNGSADIVESSPFDTSKFNSIKVGDIMKFTGSLQYMASSTGAKSNKAKPYRVKITKKSTANSAHPLHARSINDRGEYVSGIYGWINLSDVEEEYTKPFLVKVTSSSLNIRKGPSVLNSITGVIKDCGIYTIVDTKNGWGLLKSRIQNRDGWINLSYTKRL